MAVVLENEAVRRGFEVEEEFDLVKLGFALGVENGDVVTSSKTSKEAIKEADQQLGESR